MYNSQAAKSPHFFSEGAIAKISIDCRSNISTQFKFVHYLVLNTNSSECIAEILKYYDIDTVSSVVKINHQYKYELAQKYSLSCLNQLSHLIHFLIEKNFISIEEQNKFKEMFKEIHPCQNHELTALFNGGPLSRHYILSLFYPADPFYGSDYIGQDPDEKRSATNFQNNDLVNEIEKKLRYFDQNNAIGLIQNFTSTVEKVIDLFEKQYEPKLKNLLCHYDDKLSLHQPKTYT